MPLCIAPLSIHPFYMGIERNAHVEWMDKIGHRITSGMVFVLSLHSPYPESTPMGGETLPSFIAPHLISLDPDGHLDPHVFPARVFTLSLVLD